MNETPSILEWCIAIWNTVMVLFMCALIYCNKKIEAIFKESTQTHIRLAKAMNKLAYCINPAHDRYNSDGLDDAVMKLKAVIDEIEEEAKS